MGPGAGRQDREQGERDQCQQSEHRGIAETGWEGTQRHSSQIIGDRGAGGAIGEWRSRARCCALLSWDNAMASTARLKGLGGDWVTVRDMGAQVEDL